MSGYNCSFWHTQRGVMLADRTLPQLVAELRRLNDHLDRERAEETKARSSRKDGKP
jgi:hypothetical protein